MGAIVVVCGCTARAMRGRLRASCRLQPIKYIDTSYPINDQLATFDQKDKISNNHQSLQGIQKVATYNTTVLIKGQEIFIQAYGSSDIVPYRTCRLVSYKIHVCSEKSLNIYYFDMISKCFAYRATIVRLLQLLYRNLAKLLAQE